MAVGETAILLHPHPHTCSRCFYRDGEWTPAERMTVLPTAEEAEVAEAAAESPLPATFPRELLLRLLLRLVAPVHPTALTAVLPAGGHGVRRPSWACSLKQLPPPPPPLDTRLSGAERAYR